MASALYMVKKDLPKNNRLDDRVPACAQICWFVRIHAAGVEMKLIAWRQLKDGGRTWRSGWRSMSQAWKSTGRTLPQKKTLSGNCSATPVALTSARNSWCDAGHSTNRPNREGASDAVEIQNPGAMRLSCVCGWRSVGHTLLKKCQVLFVVFRLMEAVATSKE